jgi:hypothetical protein
MMKANDQHNQLRPNEPNKRIPAVCVDALVGRPARKLNLKGEQNE